MKKFICAVLALVMVLSLAACGSKQDDNSGKTDVDLTAQEVLDKLKETLKGEDTDAIKAATEELTQLFYKMSEKLYQQQAPQGDPNMGGQQPGGDPNGGQQYYDADYKVVDDDDQNNK